MTGVEAQGVSVQASEWPAACQVARFFGFGRKKQAPEDETKGRGKGKGK